jgi:hypothetical protein
MKAPCQKFSGGQKKSQPNEPFLRHYSTLQASCLVRRFFVRRFAVKWAGMSCFSRAATFSACYFYSSSQKAREEI